MVLHLLHVFCYVFSFGLIEGLKLKLHYFGHLMQRTDSLAKTLILGKTGQEEKGMTKDEMVEWHH